MNAIAGSIILLGASICLAGGFVAEAISDEGAYALGGLFTALVLFVIATPVLIAGVQDNRNSNGPPHPPAIKVPKAADPQHQPQDQDRS